MSVSHSGFLLFFTSLSLEADLEHDGYIMMSRTIATGTDTFAISMLEYLRKRGERISDDPVPRAMQTGNPQGKYLLKNQAPAFRS